MIAKVSIINYYELADKLTDEQWNSMRDVIPQWPEKNNRWVLNDLGLVDLDIALPALHAAHAEVKLEPYQKSSMIVKLKDQLTKLEDKLARFQEGSVVQIHVPDLGLMYINEVIVLEDICTEVLQEHLDNGWRILAVCPPNAQRRPDYILGKRNNERR